MTLGFIETIYFAQHRADYFGSDDAYSAVQQALLSNPQLGPVIRGCGGLRIIYLYLPESQRVVFLDVYDKDDAEDITLEERKRLAATAQAMRLQFQQQSELRKLL